MYVQWALVKLYLFLTVHTFIAIIFVAYKHLYLQFYLNFPVFNMEHHFHPVQKRTFESSLILFFTDEFSFSPKFAPLRSIREICKISERYEMHVMIYVITQIH